jgi:hypothetical protein
VWLRFNLVMFVARIFHVNTYMLRSLVVDNDLKRSINLIVLIFMRGDLVGLIAELKHKIVRQRLLLGQFASHDLNLLFQKGVFYL